MINKKPIPLNRPWLTGQEQRFMSDVLESRQLGGNGKYTRLCEELLQELTGCRRALLTPSCTGALEMAALLAGILPGDEVIMPSFTFVSTANAFVLRGGIPVFVDIREDNLNIDAAQIEAAITTRTRAIVPIHYAGVAADMDAITAIARRHGLLVIEDAAHGICASHDSRHLGSLGQLGTLSFHATKNIQCGEGGALLVNDESLIERAEVLREKGTNRARFLEAKTNRYTWMDIGQSQLMSELSAAFLWAQLNAAEEVTALRMTAWSRYHEALHTLEQEGHLRRPEPGSHAHNGHLYFIVLRSAEAHAGLLQALRQKGIETSTHYVPLHSSPAGRTHARSSGALYVTEKAAELILRLPLWPGIDHREIDFIAGSIRNFFSPRH